MCGLVARKSHLNTIGRSRRKSWTSSWFRDQSQIQGDWQVASTLLCIAQMAGTAGVTDFESEKSERTSIQDSIKVNGRLFLNITRTI
jgi:hypothetical protein